MKKASFLLISLLVIVADQVSKWAVSERFIRPRLEGQGAPLGLLDWYRQPPARLPFDEEHVTSFFNIVLIWNRGMSFGIFNHDMAHGTLLMLAISLSITAIFLVLLFRSRISFQSVGIAIVIGGALANVVDRLRFGAVIDFLDFHIGDWHWPSFNVADSTVFLGVCILVVWGMFFEKPRDAEHANIKHVEM